MVEDAWDEVFLELPGGTPLSELKRQALELTHVNRNPSDYLLKYRGASLGDESRSMVEAGLVQNAALIVLSRRRRPVRSRVVWVTPVVSRTLTLIAAAVLAFDGAALAVLGYMTRRVVLVPVGLAFLVASGLILLYWRWYRRRLDDILAARRELSEEARAMLESVSGKGKA
jgi:hypothetical protein